MVPISSEYIRIIHEYEIADASNQHFASIIYVREVNANNNNSTLCDDVDAMMENVIMHNCNVCRHNAPKRIVFKEEVEELNKRLLEEFQLKAYITFYSEIQGVGKDMEYSRVTIHATILVKDEADVHFFDNVGFSQQVAYPQVEAFTFYYHTPSPVYTLQEHPLVHGIVCYKEATNSDILYLLYRHDVNPEESILASVDIKQGKIDFLQGTEPDERAELGNMSQAFISQNNYAPLYRYRYEKSAFGYCVPTRIILNRERDKFIKAKDLVLNELAKTNNCIKYSSVMAQYLKMMFEA